jgi:hypothetical protein
MSDYYYRALRELSESELKKIDYKGYEITIDFSSGRPAKNRYVALVNGEMQGMSHTAARAEALARQYIDNLVFNASLKK